MTNSRKAKGTLYERQLKKMLEDKGFFVTRASGSIDSSDYVLLQDRGLTTLRPIREFIGKPANDLRTCSFDSSLNFSYARTNGLISHPLFTKFFEVVLSSGRRFKATAHHSLFGLREGELRPIATGQLVVGDMIAVPIKVPSSVEIEILDLLPFFLELADVDLKKIYVDVASGRHLGRYGVCGNRLINYKKRLNDVPKNAFFYINLKEHVLPRFLTLSNDLCKLLGYLAAEGSIDPVDRRVSFTFSIHEQNLVEDVERCVRNVFGFKCTRTYRHNAIITRFSSSIVVALFLNILKVGYGARSRRVPDVIYNVSEQKKLDFLRCFLLGDGCRNKKMKRIDVGVASKELVAGLGYLSSMLGFHYGLGLKETKTRRIEGRVLKATTHFAFYLYADCPISELRRPLEPRRNGVDSVPATYLRDLLSSAKGMENIFRKKHRLSLHKKYVSKAIAMDVVSLIKKHSKNAHVLTEALIRAEALLESQIGFLEVKSITETEPTDGVVYDFSVPGKENFVGGFGPVCLHNSGSDGISPDLIVLKMGKRFALECKAWKNNLHFDKPKVTIYREWEARTGLPVYIAWKFPHKPWRFFPLAMLNETHAGFSLTENELNVGLTFENLVS